MIAETSRHAVPARFPALEKLGLPRRSKRIPFVQQLTTAECGVACLAMVLAYHGKHVSREQLRSALGSTRDGAKATALLNAARQFGLRGRGVKVDLEELAYLPPGSILHWNLNHYVVLQSVSRHGAEIVDPALGPRQLTWPDVDKALSGIALTLEPADDFSESKPAASRAGSFWTLIASAGEWRRIFLISAFSQALSLALPLLIGIIVDRVIPRGDESLLMVVSVGLLALVLFQWLAAVLRGHLILNMRTALEASMTTGLLEQMLALPYSFFQQRYTGDLSVRLNSTSTIREILTSGALSAVLDGSMMSVYLLLLLCTSPALGGIVVGLALVEIAIAALTRRRQRLCQAKALERRVKYEDYQFEMLAGMETIKSTGCSHRALSRWSDLFVEVLNTGLETGQLSITFEALTSALRMGAPLVIFAVGASQVLAGQLTMGTMLAINTFAVGVFGAMSSLVATAVQFDRLGIYFDRIADVHDTPREQAGVTTRPASTLKGDIQVENLSFSYGATQILRDVSLHIRPGEFVALVGRSGSGKSTLASLLLGLLTPGAGRVSYDGEPLSTLEVTSVRQQLGIVTQGTHLFGTTIRANIAFSDPEKPLDHVIEAARLAQIHDEISAMPLGYDTILSGGGGAISGGQRQRLALARALLGRPAILLLDEATSSLDAITEQRVQQAIARLDCTRIVIAHRLSTVVDADRICVLDHGQLVEQGTHAELLERAGVYAELVAQQTREGATRELPRSA